MKTLLFIGDSITASHRLFLETPHTLGDGYVSLIHSELPSDRYIIINRGHDGFTVKDLLRCLDRDCLVFHADMITILIGVNDIAAHVYGRAGCIPDAFEHTYRTLLQKIRSVSQKTDLILMEPFVFSSPREYLHFHPYISLESQCIRRLAQEFHASFLPLQKLMNAQNNENGTSPLTVDGIHLSSSGNRFLADQWLALARPILDRSL